MIAGLALFDTMQHVKSPIVTINLGLAVNRVLLQCRCYPLSSFVRGVNGSTLCKNALIAVNAKALLSTILESAQTEPLAFFLCCPYVVYAPQRFDYSVLTCIFPLMPSTIVCLGLDGELSVGGRQERQPDGAPQQPRDDPPAHGRRPGPSRRHQGEHTAHSFT